MNLENEKIPSSVNAPDSYHKEFESRLLQRLGISLDNSMETIQTVSSQNPTVQLNPVSKNNEAQKIARKQDPETVKSEAVRKEIQEVGDVHIEPLVVSTNENPEWVNFAANEGENSVGVDGIVKITHAQDSDSPRNSMDVGGVDSLASENALEDSHVVSINNPSPEEVPAWNEIVSDSQPNVQESVVMESEISTESSNLQDGSNNDNQPVIVHHVPETLFSEKSDTLDSTIDQPQETILYNQSEPGLDILEPPPTPFAPIAGRVQNTSSSPGWIGIAASLAAIVAAYFIWVAIQPAADDTPKVVLAPEPAIEKPVQPQAAPKDTVPAGIRLVENYILDEKLEKYKEPNVFSVHQLDELPERSKKALNDLEHHNIAIFDMEDVMFEELDLLIQ